MTSTDASGPPIFIVGAPRSGTTLLAAMLGGHSRLACGPETGFFTRLSDVDLARCVAADDWVSSAMAALRSLDYPDGRSVAHHFGLDESEVSGFLRTHDRGVRSLLESIVLLSMHKQGKRRWVEKTPLHLLHLARIVAVCPKAKIIRIMRDPRDSAASMMKLPGGSQSFVTNCYKWMSFHLQSASFFEQNPDAVTIRYEDLMADPEGVLRRTASFVGEEFEPEMLAYRAQAARVTTQSEPWKKQVGENLDGSRVLRWKKELAPPLVSAGSMICHDAIVELGYEAPVAPRSWLDVRPISIDYIDLNESRLLELAERGTVIRPCAFRQVGEFRRLAGEQSPLLGSFPLGRGVVRRSLRCVQLVALFVRRRLAGRPVRYLKTLSNGPTFADRVCRLALSMFGRPERQG